MELRRKAKKALDDVSDAARQTVDTTQWATVALVSVAAVSVLALGLAVVALMGRQPAHVDK